MKVLFIGDIYMELGQKAFQKYFLTVKNEYKPHFIIVNGENIEKGNGLSFKIYKEYLEQGVNGVGGADLACPRPRGMSRITVEGS